MRKVYSITLTVCPSAFGGCRIKYPLMYETCDLLVVNKIDVMEYFDFSKKGEGVPELADWLMKNVKKWIVADR